MGQNSALVQGKRLKLVKGMLKGRQARCTGITRQLHLV